MPQVSGGTHLLDAQKILDRLEIKEGAKIADLGCGAAGHFTVPTARAVGSKGTVFAVDILKSVLAAVESRAKLERLSNIQTIWADLEIVRGTKIKEASMDIAFLHNVLFQSKEHENIFREAARILKSQGKLLVIDWEMRGTPFGPPVMDRVKKEEVVKLAEKAGFQKEAEFKPGTYHYGFVFKKL